MLTFDAVRKAYGTTMAVDGLTLAMRPGEILGLLGPNGAGKSTLVHLAVGLLTPDSGGVRIEGHGNPNDAAVRGHIGVAPQALALYDVLSARENLSFFGRIYGLSGAALAARVDACLAIAGLTDRAQALVQTYSGGMKRRLNLAAAILHEPDLLLLDEPTVGVDPQSRNQIFETIDGLRREGRSIVYTTHYMEEAARLCDRVAIVDHGRLLALGTVAELLAQHAGPPTLIATTATGEHRLQTSSPLEALNALAAESPVTHFHVEQATLEQVFLQLTGRSLRD